MTFRVGVTTLGERHRRRVLPLGLLSLFQRRNAPPMRAAPEGVRLYAVGDVHGRLDVLAPLVEAVREDAQGGPPATLIFLGDYVDRGPESKGVIDALVALQADRSIATHFIRGNHEETMLSFLLEPSVGPTWCNFGGAETLESYGVTPPSRRDDSEGWAAARDALAERLPKAHLQFLQALEPFVVLGDYFFTHAGARPGVALEDQDGHDLMWIRDEFLHSTAVFTKAVVHGHTPEPEAFVSDRRIGVDTGAYATGRLTAVVLERTERRLLDAHATAGRISINHVSILRPVEGRAASR